jgi:hypothetical protein
MVPPTARATQAILMAVSIRPALVGGVGIATFSFTAGLARRRRRAYTYYPMKPTLAFSHDALSGRLSRRRFLSGAGLAVAARLEAGEEAGFAPMFDGRTLEGWDGDPRLWSIQDGVVVGSTDKTAITHNSFLITKRDYSNFVLRTEVRLRNHNSGIQFRSRRLADWAVQGLQADMAADNWWGSIYDERGTRGTIVNGWKGKAERVVDPGGWNRYEVRCDGDFIQLKVNGLVTAELRDDSARTGVIALQLHAGQPMKVEFRDMRIRLLNG